MVQPLWLRLPMRQAHSGRCVCNVAETATDPPPDSWEEIGYWEWEGGAKVAGGDTIHFYVIDPAVEQRPLREHFENFPHRPVPLRAHSVNAASRRTGSPMAQAQFRCTT